jgi:hypothetical protein
MSLATAMPVAGPSYLAGRGPAGASVGLATGSLRLVGRLGGALPTPCAGCGPEREWQQR